MPRKGWSSLETPAGWYQVIRGPRPKLAPEQQWRPSPSSWWQYGWQRDAPKQKTQTFQRRWQRTKSGQDPEEVRVAARVRVERLENALAALGETESTVARGLTSALKEARRAAQGSAGGCANHQMPSVHPAFPEPSPPNGAGTSGGAKGFGRSASTSCPIARRGVEISRATSERGKPCSDTGRCCGRTRRSVCRDSPAQSQVGQSGDGTKQFDEEARQVCVSSVVRHSTGESEHQRVGIARQTFHHDADGNRPGKFLGCFQQPVQSSGIVNVISLNGYVKQNSQYGLRGVRVGEASHPGPPRLRLVNSHEVRQRVGQVVVGSMGQWCSVLSCVQGIRIDVK